MSKELSDKDLDIMVARIIGATVKEKSGEIVAAFYDDQGNYRAPLGHIKATQHTGSVPRFNPSWRMEHAWRAVDYMRDQGLSVFVDAMPDEFSAQIVDLSCEHQNAAYASGEFRGGYCCLSEVTADTGPHAICLAIIEWNRKKHDHETQIDT